MAKFQIKHENSPVRVALSTGARLHQKKLKERLKQIWYGAIRAFIEETLLFVHIDTGMSAASLLPLAAAVRMRSALAASVEGRGPKPGHKAQSTPAEFLNNVAKFKSRALGERLGKSAYRVEVTDTTYEFYFKIPVYQYYLWEFGLVTSQEGLADSWDSLEYGKAAFRKYLDENLGNLRIFI